MADQYYESRFKFDPNRRKVWTEIVRHHEKHIGPCKTVVDLGAGYCDFINLIDAEEKYAVDISEETLKYKAQNVRFLRSTAWDMSSIESDSVDLVHASNLFEHFDDAELVKVISEVQRVLKVGGYLVLMQPNYKLAMRDYFDDYTHKKVWTPESLGDFLSANGFEILLKKSRFLPFSMKSSGNFPVIPLIVRAYINSPIKPFAGQMLFIAKNHG